MQAVAVAPNFAPTHITGCQLWLPANRISGLVDGDPVASWTDFSGNSNHAVQATGSKKPTYKTSIVNGLAVVRYDGSDDVLVSPADFPASFTIFAVVARTFDAATNRYLIAPNATDNPQLAFLNNTNTFTWFGVGTTAAYTPSAFHVLTIYRNGSTTGSIQVNGGTAVTGVPGTGTSTDTVIGAAYTQGNVLHGDLAEVIMYNVVLTSDQRQQIEQMLAAKYAITMSVTYPNRYYMFLDFDNDGDFDGADEYVTPNVLVREPVTCRRGRDQVTTLSPIGAGDLTALLNNTSRIYSRENAAGALAGNLEPGRLVRLSQVQDTAETPLWTGIIHDLIERPDPTEKSVQLVGIGRLSALANVKVSTALYQSIRVDVAIGYLLDAVGWPTADRSLQVAQTTLDWWWLDDEDALTALQKLQDAEGQGAVIFEGKDGYLTFHDRHYRITASAATVVQATFRGTGAEPVHSAPLRYDPRRKDLVKTATFEYKLRTAKGLAEVWALGSTVTLGPNEVRKYQARDSAGDPFTAAATPTVPDGDYTVASGSLASITLDRTSGASVTITLTAGAAGASITGLRLRAQLVSVDNTVQVSNTVADGTEGLIFPYPILPEIALNTMQDLANAFVALNKSSRPQVQITLQTGPNGVASRLTQARTRDISDRVNVRDTQTGLDSGDDFWVERIEHRIGGQYHEASLGLAKAGVTTYWVLGSSALDGADVLAY